MRKAGRGGRRRGAALDCRLRAATGRPLLDHLRPGIDHLRQRMWHLYGSQGLGFQANVLKTFPVRSEADTAVVSYRVSSPAYIETPTT